MKTEKSKKPEKKEEVRMAVTVLDLLAHAIVQTAAPATEEAPKEAAPAEEAAAASAEPASTAEETPAGEPVKETYVFVVLTRRS